MDHIKEQSIIYTVGSVGYGLIELLWRGYTHWTMLLTGGLCFSVLYRLTSRPGKKPMWKKCLLGSGIITGIEFCVGCVVNLWLNWNVWDYSKMPFNLFGQVCVLYSMLWFFLTIPIAHLSSYIRHHFFRHSFR